VDELEEEGASGYHDSERFPLPSMPRVSEIASIRQKSPMVFQET